MIHEFAIVWEHKDRLLAGLANTVWLVALSSLLALVLGALVAMALMSRSPALSRTMRWFVDGMRCLPFLLLTYLLYYALPTLGIRFDNWTCGLIALAIYNAAYVGEILRGAWASLPTGTVDAGHALGFHGVGLYRRIVLPPVIFAAAPVLGNQVIQIIKDSAFLMIIAVPELTHAASSIQTTYFVPFAAFVAAVALYWALCRIVEAAVASIDRRGALTR